METENNALWDAITRKISRESSKEDEETLKQWLDEAEINRKSYDVLSSIRIKQDEKTNSDDKKQIFSELINSIHRNKSKVERKLPKKILLIAASVALIFATAMVSYIVGKQNFTSQLIDVYSPKGIKSNITLSDGTKIMDETRVIRFLDFGKARLVVLEIDLHASVCPITFGDTKEGSMGIRINDQIRADKGKGKIVTRSLKPLNAMFLASISRLNTEGSNANTRQPRALAA